MKIILVVLAQETIPCENNLYFAGIYNGEKCESWKGRNCMSDKWHLGAIEQRTLLEQCPKSCGLCGENQIILEPVLEDPEYCEDHPEKFLLCRDYAGAFCHLIEDKQIRFETLNYCRESCGICKKDYSRTPIPNECKFPFKVHNQWYHSCEDTVGLSDYTYTPNQLITIEKSWCPTELEEDHSIKKDTFKLKCFEKRANNKAKYELCLTDNDCRSRRCETHFDGKKRCQRDTKRECVAKDGPGECPEWATCNPHGHWAKFSYHLRSKDNDNWKAMADRANAVFRFYLTEPSTNRTKEEVFKIVEMKYHILAGQRQAPEIQQANACIRTEYVAPTEELVVGQANICIGHFKTVACDIGEYCHAKGFTQKEMCLKKPSSNSSDHVIIAVCVLFIVLIVLIYIIVCVFRNNLKKCNTPSDPVMSEKEYIKQCLDWAAVGSKLDKNENYTMDLEKSYPRNSLKYINPIASPDINGTIKTKSTLGKLNPMIYDFTSSIQTGSINGTTIARSNSF